MANIVMYRYCYFDYFITLKCVYRNFQLFCSYFEIIHNMLHKYFEASKMKADVL